MALFARAPLLCAAFFAIAPLLWALPQNEIQMTLYMLQSWSGPTKSQVEMVKGFNNTRFGEIWAADWPIRDGPDLSGKVIGRAQGSLMKVTQTAGGYGYHTSMNLVFNDASRFGGSTFQMLGMFQNNPVRHWSIVGGTGQFTMARGVAEHNDVKTNADWNLYKVDIHAYYSSMDSTEVYAKSGFSSKICEPTGEQTIA